MLGTQRAMDNHKDRRRHTRAPFFPGNTEEMKRKLIRTDLDRKLKISPFIRFIFKGILCGIISAENFTLVMSKYHRPPVSSKQKL